MQNSLQTVLDRIQPTDRVLDLGAWNAVIPRADVVVDLIRTRPAKSSIPETPERFDRSTWIRGDVHSLDLWRQFRDKEFDFVICSHFLEDIRDPLVVCEQMNRVAKAGYIECPSRFRECAKIRKTDIYSGYDHHRWILDVIDGDVVLTPKLAWGHAFDYLGDERRSLLYRWEVQFVALFWEGSFNFYERFPKGNALEAANLLHFYDTADVTTAPWVFSTRDGQSRARAQAGSCLWVTEYQLPVESDKNFQSYLSSAQELIDGGMLTVATYAREKDALTDAVGIENSVRETRLRECEDALATLKAGKAWRLAETLQSIRHRVAPTGSRRDRLVRRLNR